MTNRRSRTQRGDIFGPSPFLGFERFTTTAPCAEPSAVLAIEVAAFRQLLDERVTVGQAVMNVMAKAFFSRYIETLRRLQNTLNERPGHERRLTSGAGVNTIPPGSRISAR